MAHKPTAKTLFDHDIIVFFLPCLAVCAGVFFLPDAIYSFLTWSTTTRAAEKNFTALIVSFILILAGAVFFAKWWMKKSKN